MTDQSPHTRPLDPLRSIKTKLGLLVGVSVLLAVLLGMLGSGANVPAWLTLPVAVAISLGVTQLLAGGMTAPLREMTQATARMARGDYSVRVETESNDEVGRLAAAFNTMAGDLATVDRERRDLIATVSHELRTPLAALSAQLENLADGVVPADAEHLAAPLAQAERLSGLVRDLLDLSRLEAGVLDLRVEDVAVHELVTGAIDEVHAAGRPGAVDVSVPESLVVTVDPNRLRQILVNAVDNAARHAPAGTLVRVLAGRDGDRWWLEVHDDGPGLSPADRERAFARWGTDGHGGGTGLGLTVARWAARLHGGTLRFVDADGAVRGARLRLEMPDTSETPDTSAPPDTATAPPPSPSTPNSGQPTRQEIPVSVPPSPIPAAAPAWAPSSTEPAPGGFDSLFGRFWEEPKHQLPGLRVVVASAVAGVVAGSIMAFAWPGISWLIVLVLAGAAAIVTARHRRDRFTLGCVALATLLVLPIALRDDIPIAILCVLASAAVFLIGVTRAHRLLGFVVTGLCWPLASIRGLPWFGRSLRVVGTSGKAPAVVRTLAWSIVALVVFGALFASADALFASWVDRFVPDLSIVEFVQRGFVGFGVFGVTLAAAYLAMNPARVEPEQARDVPRLRNRWEWLLPVLLVDLVFVVFLASQAAAVLGGHGYVERTTGMSYADYVHQGFGQLTLATMLTLAVVALASHRAGRDDRDRLWLRLSLGLLCLLTLVVVTSALYRMHLYQEAYGFTVLRMLVDVFEGWLGLVIVLVMVAGVTGLGRWLPRAALITGAVSLLAFAMVNPDAWVAGRNIDRYEATQRLDLDYLKSLSADAAPTIADRLPAPIAACALRDLRTGSLAADVRDDPLAWNLGRHRAGAVLDRPELADPGAAVCREMATALDAGTP